MMANDGLVNMVNMVNMVNLWKPPFVRFMKCGMPKSPWGFNTCQWSSMTTGCFGGTPILGFTSIFFENPYPLVN